MRLVFLAFLIGTAFALSACSTKGPANSSDPARPESRPPGEREPVLVELFTSEGCGNCPPADRQLAFLEEQQPIAGADVITLGYHVDYFNDRGWKDPYSSAEYTKRQNLYAMRLGSGSIYTPQMIVDGSMQFVGSDPKKASETIASAARPNKPEFSATVNGNIAEVRFTGFERHNIATVVLAAAEDGLVSDVKAGNNKGKKLTHISVVRQLRAFGKLPEKAVDFTGSVELPTDPSWKAENVRYIVYVQEDTSGRILGAGRIPPAR